jgi:hypothetical protein
MRYYLVHAVVGITGAIVGFLAACAILVPLAHQIPDGYVFAVVTFGTGMILSRMGLETALALHRKHADRELV